MSDPTAGDDDVADDLDRLIDDPEVPGWIVAALRSMRTLRDDLVKVSADLQRDRRRWKWERRWPVAIAVAALVASTLSVGAVLASIAATGDAETAIAEAAAAAVIARDESCANRKVLRDVVRQIDAVADGGGGIVFAIGPKYDALPEWLKDYLTNELQPELNASPPDDGEPSDLVVRLLAAIPPC